MFCPEREEWSGSELENNQKPLPLKQRTSSCTDRRDFTPNTWISLLQLIKFREYLVTVNHFSIWRRHNAWSMENGKDLRAYITQRYSSAMVFMSLLLSTEFGVLFNSSTVASQVRDNLVNAHWNTVGFWAGLFIIISALFTILSLISTFSFTAMISAINEANAHCILRSSIGQYATELPGRFIVGSIYTFLISFMAFFFMLLPVGYFSICLLVGTVALFVHVVSVFSSFGRIIMHTGAMSKERIFSSEYEESLVPHSLHSNLLSKAKCNIKNNISIIRQYRTKQKSIDRFLFEEDLYDHLSGTSESVKTSTIDHRFVNTANANRIRADSKVRFADEEQGLINNGKHPFGENGDQIYRTNRHNPSLTPLSDLSGTLLYQGDQLSSTRSTISDDTIASVPSKDETGSASARKFFTTSERPQLISALPLQRGNSIISSVNTVSNASLEQWLRGSQSGDGEKDDDELKLKRSLDAKRKDEDKSQQIFVPQMGSEKPVSINTSTWINSVANETIKLDEKKDEWNRSSKVPKQLDLDSRSILDRRAKEREMSEDERFVSDYGDFGNDFTKVEERAFPRTNGNFEDDSPPQKTEDVGNISLMQNERTKLLK